jgi:hypothetical protein
MAQGFVPDFSYGQTLVGSWYEGAPRKSWFGQAKAKMNKGIPIAAYRCASCGFIEFYSKPEFAAQQASSD